MNANKNICILKYIVCILKTCLASTSLFYLVLNSLFPYEMKINSSPACSPTLYLLNDYVTSKESKSESYEKRNPR